MMPAAISAAIRFAMSVFAVPVTGTFAIGWFKSSKNRSQGCVIAPSSLAIFGSRGRIGRLAKVPPQLWCEDANMITILSILLLGLEAGKPVQVRIEYQYPTVEACKAAAKAFERDEWAGDYTMQSWQCIPPTAR
jgi:hypothetical protein